MRTTLFISCLLVLLWSCQDTTSDSTMDDPASTYPTPSSTPAAYAIVIHGGAGAISREKATPELENDYRAAMQEALRIGETLLKDGSSATDAVTQTIMYLEDNPLFNAGRGAVFTHAGKNELDASIMRGEDREAGAVAGVSRVKHPIQAARAVMEQSVHVLLSGAGADEFAAAEELEMVDPNYFFTQQRYDILQRVRAKEDKKRLEEPVGYLDQYPDRKFGTVGCVALDNAGNIAAGTSTGGMTNKRYNRIGDSPIIGAGTFADNASCGVSSTGHGEYFIRWAVASDIAARMAYGKTSLLEAAKTVVMDKLPEVGGNGGIIALDRMGNIAMPHNTPGMYRAFARPDKRGVYIFKDEPMYEAYNYQED